MADDNDDMSLGSRIVLRCKDAKSAMAVGDELRTHYVNDAGNWASHGHPPEVVVIGDSVGIHHFEAGSLLDRFDQTKLEAHDAEVGDEEQGVMLTLTATFRLPMGKPGELLAKELRTFFEQAATTPLLRDFKTAPFGALDLAHGHANKITYGHDGSLFEMHLPLSIPAVETIKKFLIGRKVEQLKLRLCVDDDLARIAKAPKGPAAFKNPSMFGSSSSTTSDSDSDSDTSRTASATSGSGDGPHTVGKRFLFTGKMASLTRDDGKKRVQWLGGVAAGSVSQDLDYLVVGDDGSPLYGAGAKGSKILAAEKLIAHGSTLKIISEKQFLELKRR